MTVEPGDVVQIDPASRPGRDYGPQLVIVERVQKWGVQGAFVHVSRRGAFGIAPLRLENGTFARVGKAVWTALVVLAVGCAESTPHMDPWSEARKWSDSMGLEFRQVVCTQFRYETLATCDAMIESPRQLIQLKCSLATEGHIPGCRVAQ